MITLPSRSPGDDSTRRSLPLGLLPFARGAAVMMLALGINGVLAGTVSRYDPTWVDVVAVALVAWFEGWVPALAAGAAALTAYELWFSRGPVTARGLAEQVFSSLAAIVIVTLGRRIRRRPRIAEVSEMPPALVTEARGPREAPSLLAPDLDDRGHLRESDARQAAGAAELRAGREAERLREELARAEADRHALQANMQAAMLRHQEESSKLKVERARAAEEAREATGALSSARESLVRLEGELTAQRRAAEEAQRLAEERAAAMLEGEAKHGADETRLRNALDQEKERVAEAAARIDALAHDLALATVERDRWQGTTAEIRQEAQRRIGELSDQYAAASAASRAVTEELEEERHRTAMARTAMADLEAAAERSTIELAAMREIAEHSAAERDRLAGQLQAAGEEIDRWHQEYSRAADDFAHASASLSELSFAQSALENLRIEHGHVSRSLEAAHLESDQLRAEHAEVSRQLAVAAETVAELGAMQSAADELREENAGLGRLLHLARAQAEDAEHSSARLLEETEALAPLRSEVERLDAAHAMAVRLLEEARAETETAREEARQIGEELARKTAGLVELSAVESAAERLRIEHENVSRMLHEARADAENAREEARRRSEELAQATAEIAGLAAVKSEAEQLRLEKIALAQAADSAKSERETAQARAALAALEIAAASETLAALNQSRGIAEQLQSENRRLAAAFAAAGREAARLQADSTHYADEVIGLRARLARGSAAPPETDALREEVARMTRELEETQGRSDSLAKERVHWEEQGRAEATRLLAEFEHERKGLREALDSAARLNVELTGYKEDSERWQVEAQRLAVQIEAAVQTAAERSAAAEEEIESLRKELAAAHSARATLDDEVRLRETMSAAVAASASSAAARVVELEADLSRVRQELADAGREWRERLTAFEDQRKAFAEADKAWDEKLRRIVEGMTTDHENDLGEAMIEREAAKAELRLASNQITRLEASLRAAEASRDAVEQEWKRRGEQVLSAIVQRETTIRAAAEREVARLRVELEARADSYQKVEGAAAEEKRRYEEAEAAWGNRLQQIVANVTNDYEADLGEAISSRETARAELRSMAIDLRRSQEKLAAAEETQRAVVAEASRRDAEIERLSADTARDAAPAESQTDGGVLRKRLHQAEQINSAWGSAFAERESELRREAEGQMADMRSQLERLRRSEAGLTEAFRAAAANEEALRRRLEEERVAAESKAGERDEAFRQGLLHAQQQWEDRIDTVVSEAEEALRQLRSRIAEQEGELAALRAHDLELRQRREDEESEELLIARQVELSRQSDEERRARFEVLQFAEDARSLLMGGSPRHAPSSVAQSDPFPEAAADPTAPAGSATPAATSASDDFLAIVTRLGGDS